MRVLIIEDEIPAANRLKKLILGYDATIEIVDIIDSVESAVQWLNTFEMPNLIFMDIQLADGLSFDIFTEVDIKAPIIFTTAFDQFTLKAFKVNSIDYLLKPIDKKELHQAIQKFSNLYQKNTPNYDQNTIENILQTLTQKQYRERFLIKLGQQFTYISLEDVAYIYSEERLVFAMQSNGKRHIIDQTLDKLQGQLDPSFFFRINRKIIIRVNAIKKIHTYFSGRLKLDILPKAGLEALVSRDRVKDFKRWLDQ